MSLTITVRFVATSEPNFMMDLEPNVLLANGIDELLVTATVLDDSLGPMVGIELEFSTSIGTLSQTTQITNSEGKAQVTLTSSASNSDLFGTVYATHDTLVGAEAVTFIGIYMTLDANPDQILANGASISHIKALLKETTSQIAVSSAEILFSTNLGLIPNSKTTDNRGLAEVQLTSSATDTGTALVVGRYGQTITDTVEVRMTGEIPGTFQISEIDASPITILANGIDQTTMTATIVDNELKPASGILVVSDGVMYPSVVENCINSSGIGTPVAFTSCTRI